MLKSINRGFPVFKNPEIVNFGVFGAHIINPRFHYTRTDQNISPEFLNLLFKHISITSDPINAKKKNA